MSKLPEYIKMRADELLEAFGKGSHKPGSGSAAAFNGLECSVLLLTVIKLTLKQKAYIESHDALNEIKAKINKTIYPTLIELFQTDAEEFHKVITLRNKKKNHKKNIIKLDLQRRIEIESKLIEAIKNATRIPIQIANLCIELAQYALQVYDIGWKAVRGDTGVAISNALSALAGCNYIISLNLLSVQGDDLDAMLMETDLQRLNSEYTKLNSNAYSKFNHLSTELETKYNFQYFLKEKQVDKEEYRKLQDTDIEKLANQILNELWDKKNKLWKIKIPTKEINVINTKKVLENMGFQLFTEETLGVTDYEHHEIGGIMNRELKVVLTSSLHKPVVQNFTAAHELGHVLLHTDNILFRDVPLNGEIRRTPKELKERQADLFAVYFLMPKKQVIKGFFEIFGKDLIKKEEILQYDHDNRSFQKDLKYYSGIIASLTFYNGVPFEKSMSQIFNVSKEAMAIRLIELGLIVE